MCWGVVGRSRSRQRQRLEVLAGVDAAHGSQERQVGRGKRLGPQLGALEYMHMCSDVVSFHGCVKRADVTSGLKV